MSATTTQRRRPHQRNQAAKRSKALPRPALPGIRSENFTLAWYFRKLTEHDALHACRSVEFGKRRQNDALTFALTDAISRLDDEIVKVVEDIRREGRLLLAHPGTTVFQLNEGGAA